MLVLKILTKSLYKEIPGALQIFDAKPRTKHGTLFE
jgi:hypothetical protein